MHSTDLLADRLVSSLTSMMKQVDITEQHEEVKLDNRTPGVILNLLCHVRDWTRMCNGVGKFGWISLRGEVERCFSMDTFQPKSAPQKVVLFIDKFRALVIDSEMYADVAQYREGLKVADSMRTEASQPREEKESKRHHHKRKPVDVVTRKRPPPLSLSLL